MFAVEKKFCLFLGKLKLFTLDKQKVPLLFILLNIYSKISAMRFSAAGAAT